MGSIYDNPEMTGAFLDELEEQLQLLEQYILDLERDDEISEVIPNIFRIAHTLKGSSSLIGFEKMTILTHEMENVLDKIRNHQLEVTKPVISILFQCLDYLRLLKNDFLANRNDIKTDISSVLNELTNILLEGHDKNEKKLNNMVVENRRDKTNQENLNIEFVLDLEQQMLIENARVSGYNVFVCEINLKQDTVMKLAHACLILNHLNEMGTVIQVEPNILEEEQLLISTIYYLLLTQLDDETIKTRVVNQLMEIDYIKIYPYYFNTSKQQLVVAENEKVTAANSIDSSVIDVERKVNHTVRVDVERLEKMMDLVGELVIERTRVNQVGSILHWC